MERAIDLYIRSLDTPVVTIGCMFAGVVVGVALAVRLNNEDRIINAAFATVLGAFGGALVGVTWLPLSVITLLAVITYASMRGPSWLREVRKQRAEALEKDYADVLRLIEQPKSRN